ncbi:MAG: SurA N-terminal domain-containing protein, partial [Henriciella sp.]
MLTIMRQLLRSKAAGFLFVILIVSMAAWGVTDVFGGSLANKMISAGDRSVSSEQFDATVERQLRLMTDDRGRSMLKEQALEQGVIDQLLQSQQFSLALSAYGDRIGITVTDDNIKDQILSMDGFLDSTGLFDPARYDQILRDNGYTPSTFEAAIESELTELRLRQLPAAALFVPDTLAETTALYSAEARSAEWFLLNQSQLPAPPDPTDADLETLYNEAEASLLEPERRDISLLKIGVDDFTTQADIDDADIRSFYDAYKRERYVGPDTRAYTIYNFETEDLARAALGQIAGGAADAEIAGLSLSSEVTGRAESIANERLQSQVFSPGALEQSIHGPVLDNGSWVIVRIERIIEGEAVPYDDVREAIADELAREIAVDLFYESLPRLDDLIGTGASLEAIGQDLGIPVLMYSQIDQRGLNARSQPVTAMQESQELLDIVFASSEGTTTE